MVNPYEESEEMYEWAKKHCGKNPDPKEVKELMKDFVTYCRQAYNRSIFPKKGEGLFDEKGFLIPEKVVDDTGNPYALRYNPERSSGIVRHPGDCPSTISQEIRFTNQYYKMSLSVWYIGIDDEGNARYYPCPNHFTITGIAERGTHQSMVETNGWAIPVDLNEAKKNNAKYGGAQIREQCDIIDGTPNLPYEHFFLFRTNTTPDVVIADDLSNLPNEEMKICALTVISADYICRKIYGKFCLTRRKNFPYQGY